MASGDTVVLCELQRPSASLSLWSSWLQITWTLSGCLCSLSVLGRCFSSWNFFSLFYFIYFWRGVLRFELGPCAC
jgi:hypothetical protein